jgi:GrpB-like predicted nucleotidyltransferase (UPF0157 family)
MPFYYEFAFRPAVVQLTASGAPDLAEWRAAMDALVRHPELPADAPLLCDLRYVRGLPRNRHARIAVRELLQLVPERRVAFVAGKRIAARLEAELSGQSRDAFEVFTAYEAALRWLVFEPSPNRESNGSRTRLVRAWGPA